MRSSLFIHEVLKGLCEVRISLSKTRSGQQVPWKSRPADASHQRAWLGDTSCARAGSRGEWVAHWGGAAGSRWGPTHVEGWTGAGR